MMAVGSFQLYSKSIFSSIASNTTLRVPIKDALKTLHWSFIDFQPHPASSSWCNLDFVPAPLWPSLMNSPHTLSYLSMHFFRSCWWNYSCRTHPSMALQHGLKGQWVDLPRGQKSPVLKCFVGVRQQLHISNLSRCTETPSSALQTGPALLPWNATLTLLLGQYCSNPVTAHLRDHEMSNNGCGTLPWHHTLACCAIKALERSFAGDTWEQSPIYFSLGMIVPAQKDTQAALLNKAAVLSHALCLLNAQSVSQGSELRLDKFNKNLGNIRFKMTTFASSET